MYLRTFRSFMNNFLVSLCIFNTYCQNWFHSKFLFIKDACLSSDQTQQEFKHFSKKTNLIFHKREKPPLQPKSSLPYIYILIYKILKFAKLAKSKIKTRERAACHGRKSKIPRILKREDGRRGKRHNARNVMEGGGWVSRFPCKCIDARATIGRSARGALTILSSPILPYKRDKRRRKGMVSVDNGSNSIAPDIHSSRMQRRSFGRARRGEKKGRKPGFHLLWRPSTRALYEYSWNFNALSDNDPRSRIRAAVVIPSSSRPRCRRLREPWHANAERASNSPNRCSNIKRNVNESRENDENPYFPCYRFILPYKRYSYKSVCKDEHVVERKLRIWEFQKRNDNSSLDNITNLEFFDILYMKIARSIDFL